MKTCRDCGTEKPTGEFHIDHHKPLARGGTHTRDNVRPCCGPCNVRKNARWPLTEEILTEIRVAVLADALMGREEVTRLCP